MSAAMRLWNAKYRRLANWLAIIAILASPLGAPFVGYLLLGVCDLQWDDQMIDGDNILVLEGADHCFVPEPFISYFASMPLYQTFLLGGALSLLGRTIGGIWLLGSAALLIRCFSRTVRTDAPAPSRAETPE